MSYLFFILKAALEDFRRNKMRTFLTSLGILIGVASVILLNAFGLGLQILIKSQFETLGTNLVFVLPGKAFTQGGGLRPGGGTLGGVRFDEKDILTLAKIKEIERLAPFFIKTVRTQANGNSQIADIRGTNTEAFLMSHLEIDDGVFFDKNDLRKKTKVAVIGAKLAEKLFGEATAALTKKIEVEGQGYKVIGILKQTGNINHDFDSSLIVPYTSTYAFNKDKKFFDIHIQIKAYEKINDIKDKIETLLLRRYHEDDFSVVEQTELLKTITTILNALNLVLVAIGTISLIVGGIGIMNIMYVSVVEKTKEIGVRRAMGATKKDILLQFMAESVILSFIGGLAGLALAAVVVIFVQRFFPAYINLQSVAIAVGVSSLIGVIFGVLPAKRAADLSPIEAIRYE